MRNLKVLLTLIVLLLASCAIPSVVVAPEAKPAAVPAFLRTPPPAANFQTRLQGFSEGKPQERISLPSMLPSAEK